MQTVVTPPGGWPAWVWQVPWVGSRHPADGGPPGVEGGANCQRFAGAVLALFGRRLPPLRSDELAAALPEVDRPAPLDVLLVGGQTGGWGAHVGVLVGPDQVLHLCAEVGHPAVWGMAEFSARPRYASRRSVHRVPEEEP